MMDRPDNYGILRQSQRTSKLEESKGIPKRIKNNVLRMMKEMPEEVIEDPNEQTHSEFPTRRTIQNVAVIDKNTMSTIQKASRPGSKSYTPFQEHNEAVKSSTKQMKTPKEPRAEVEAAPDLVQRCEQQKLRVQVESKLMNLSTIDQIAPFPDSKSVSLSFSSKYPEEDDTFSKYSKIQQIKSGLDHLNSNLAVFEQELKEAQNFRNQIGYESHGNRTPLSRNDEGIIISITFRV